MEYLMNAIIITGLLNEKAKPEQFNEMATSCHPKRNGGKYPMWIRVEYTNGEHFPPHAHLYYPDQRPSKKSLITKFIISDKAPVSPLDIKVMKGQPAVPIEFANLIVNWAENKNSLGINNWLALRNDWQGLADSLD